MGDIVFLYILIVICGLESVIVAGVWYMCHIKSVGTLKVIHDNEDNEFYMSLELDMPVEELLKNDKVAVQINYLTVPDYIMERADAVTMKHTRL